MVSAYFPVSTTKFDKSSCSRQHSLILTESLFLNQIGRSTPTLNCRNLLVENRYHKTHSCLNSPNYSVWCITNSASVWCITHSVSVWFITYGVGTYCLHWDFLYDSRTRATNQTKYQAHSQRRLSNLLYKTTILFTLVTQQHMLPNGYSPSAFHFSHKSLAIKVGGMLWSHMEIRDEM